MIGSLISKTLFVKETCVLMSDELANQRSSLQFEFQVLDNSPPVLGSACFS